MSIIKEIRDKIEEVKIKPDNINELSELMNSKDCREIIDSLIEKEKYSQSDFINAEVIIDAAQSIYNYSGNETGLTDSEYDIIFEKLELQEGKEHDITVPVISSSDTVYHRYPSLRGTLDKIYVLTEDDVLENKSRKTLDDWVKSSENKIFEKTGERINLYEEEVYAFPKYDGVSCVFEFSKDGKLERALTRGFTETNEAQDITHVFKDWFVDPLKGLTDKPHGLKTEIMMTDDDFEAYNKNYKTNYKQSRSIVSSIINSDEIDSRVQYLKVLPLRVSYLNKDGDESLQELAPGAFDNAYIKCRLKDRDALREFALNHSYVNGLRCDGMVIYIINPKIQKILGRENNKQKFEVAYKFTEEYTYSKIKDIVFTTGLFGRINPVAIIKPVKLKGNTIENISLGSMGRFRDLRLAKDDKVKVLYDIIPYLNFYDDDPKCKRSGNEPIKAPTRCIECGEKLEETESGDMLYCVNPKCPCKEKGKILNYFRKMNIDGISYATIDTLYKEGYLKSIKDIYKIEKNKKEISEIPGFGKKSVKAMIDEIESHMTVQPSVMLGSIGIESASTKTFKKILKHISYEDLIDMCEEKDVSKIYYKLLEIPGIKDKTAARIINGIKDNLKLIEYLEEKLTILDEEGASAKYSVCFTKVRDEELEKFILSHSGEIADTFNKNVSILVVPMLGTESEKVKKAKKYNIPIVPIDKLKEYIETNLLK